MPEHSWKMNRMSIGDPFQTPGWYAVRCVFESKWPEKEPEANRTHRYEERITLWQASSLDEAIELAEAEADSYAATIRELPDAYLGLAQAYALSDEPGHGAEIFSLIRSSDREPDDYLSRFFDTGHEYQSNHAT